MKPKAKYRRVSVGVWNDERVRALSDRAKLLFLFLMTHPTQTPLGAMRANVPGLAWERGWAVPEFEAAFLELTTPGMVAYDHEAGVVWLPNTLKHNPPESPNVVKAWAGGFNTLPDCDLKTEVLEYSARYVLGLSQGFRNAFLEAFGAMLPQDLGEALRKVQPEASANQEPEPEPEPEPEEETPSCEGAASPEAGDAGPADEDDAEPDKGDKPEEADAADPKHSPCPYGKIADTWNEIMFRREGLPEVRELTDTRKRKLQRLWRSKPERQSLNWWRGLFEYIAQSAFLMGKKGNFRTSFDWLLNPQNLVKIIEGNYHDGKRPTAGGANTDTFSDLMQED